LYVCVTGAFIIAIVTFIASAYALVLFLIVGIFINIITTNTARSSHSTFAIPTFANFTFAAASAAYSAVAAAADDDDAVITFASTATSPHADSSTYAIASHSA